MWFSEAPTVAEYLMPIEVKPSFLSLFWNPGWGAQAAAFRSVKSQVQAYVACLWLEDVATAVRESDLVDSWLLLGKKLGRKKQTGIVLQCRRDGSKSPLNTAPG